VTKFFLLADDDNDDAELFMEAVSSLDPPIDCFRVEDGKDVFHFLSDRANRRPDIIFLDLNMPGMNGWQCLAKLKNDVMFHDIPVIMYSTSSHYRDKEIAKELGALAFFTKPANFNILISKLEYISRQTLTELNQMDIRSHF
jgi:CheY-like chemotaxis protein